MMDARRRARRRVPDARAGRLPGAERRRDRRGRRRRTGGWSSFCRLDPRVHPAAEARRCLDAGAVGIKLHPRAEQFTMDEPGVREIVAVAHERKVPVLIHAGRGIPALGAEHGRAVGRVPGRAADPRPRRDLRPRVAVARAARPPERLHRHRLVEPGRPDRAVLAGGAVADRVGVATRRTACRSSPRSRTRAARCRRASRDEALRSIMGGQIARLVAGEDPLWVGDAPGAVEPALHPLLDRVVTHLITAWAARSADATPTSRSRWRGCRARSATTPRTPTCAPRVLESARPLPRAPRTAAARAPVPGRRALPDRRAHRRAHADRAAPGRVPRAAAHAGRGREPSPRRRR